MTPYNLGRREDNPYAWSHTRAFSDSERRRILKRDQRTCQIGLACCLGEATIADHIVPRAEAILMGWTPDQYHDLSNGQAVCVACHDSKTAEEIRRGQQRYAQRRPRRERPAARHPGLTTG